jgi:anti-sigma B factor antagonist
MSSTSTVSRAEHQPEPLPDVKAIRALLREDKDRHGVTLLMCVARCNPSPVAIAAMLEAGARVNDKDKDGATPLMYAAANNANPEIAKALIAAGADVDATDAKGRTSLIRAAEDNPNPLVITALLEAGANRAARDADGMTAREAALNNTNQSVLAALLASDPRPARAVQPRAAKPAGHAARPFTSNEDIVPGFDTDRNDSVGIELQTFDGADGVLALHLKGYVDTYNSEAFRRRVGKAIDAGYVKLIFEMSAVTYISSTGVGALTTLLRAVKPRGGDIVLDDMRPNVYEVFSLLGFSQFFPFVYDLDAAVEHFARGSSASPLTDFACPLCSSRLKAPRPGRYRCGRCKTLLSIDAAGQVLVG